MPAATTLSIAEQVRAARASRTSLRVVGAGSWLDAGYSCSATARLQIGETTGVVEYEPGDLTLTARAGTPLHEIARTTAAERQWLTLDPAGAEHATLGAVIATGSWGPLASAFGTPRDHVLGCEFVTGRGDIVRAGGRVVKNVAGFDLVRLVTGAWGTIGAITEVTVRLRALPEVERTLAVRIGEGAAAAQRAWRWMRHGEYAPLAAELLSPSLARRLAVGAETTLLVRLGGNGAFLEAAQRGVHHMGDATEVDASCWTSLADADPAGSLSFRASTLPASGAELWRRIADLAERAGGMARATVGRGVVRCVMPMTADAPVSDLAALFADTNVTWVAERLDARLWSSLAARRAPDALSERVRRAFDPDGVLNPGIMGWPA